MIKLVRVIFLLVLTVSFIGCKTTSKEESVDSAVQTNGVYVEPKPGEGVPGHQYRAVCIEKEAHAGNVQVLSKWSDSRDKAYELGNYHSDFKDKGHRWTIEERVKSETAQQ